MANYSQKNLSVTPEQAQIIIDNTPGKTTKELAEMLGLTWNIVQTNKNILGLSKKVNFNKSYDFGDSKGNFSIEKWAKAVNY